MALKIVKGKEVRVPGSAMPSDLRNRNGTLGRLDCMSFRKFQTIPNREILLGNARKQKALEAKSPEALAELKKAGLYVNVGIKDRSLIGGSYCGIAYFSRIRAEVFSDKYESSCVLGDERQYRDAYSAAKDDWRFYLQGAKVIGATIDGNRLTLDVLKYGCESYWETERISIALKPKAASPGAKEKMEDDAKKEAERILGAIKERQKHAIRPDYRGSGEMVGYDEPRLTDMNVSVDGKFAVFVIQEMIDWRIEDGRQMRWTAYKVASEGKALSIAEGHSYERAEKQETVAIAGVSDAGIELQTGKGLQMVSE